LIKLIAVGVWICAATLGAVFFAFQSAGTSAEAEAKQEASPTMMGGLDYVKTEVMSVPLIQEGEVQGYFLSRLVYTVNPEEMKKLTVPAQAIITDAVYSYVYSSPEVDFTRADRLDVDAFRNNLRERINAQVQHDLVKDVLIEQVDYLTKAEIRDNAIKRRKVVAERRKEADPAHEEAAH
jgi:flagellar basal body-associated protein FliL